MNAEEVGAVGEVHGRQPVVVGLGVLQRRVVEDHAGGAALLDVEALLDAAVAAALAGDDLAGERARRAPARRTARCCTAAPDASTTGSGPAPGGDRGARRACAVAPSAPVSVSVEANSRVCVDAATVVTHGERWLAVAGAGPVVAGRRGDEHAGGVRVEERELDRVGERVGAAARSRS